MQTRTKRVRESDCPAFEPEAGGSLLSELQALLEPYGVGAETVTAVFNETLLEISSDQIRNGMEEFRSFLLGTIVWKIFARGSALWINPQTKSGNKVPLDVMVAAYSVWKHVMQLAAKHGIDAAAAADGFVKVAHRTADRIIGERRNKRIGPVRDPGTYMFAAFLHVIPQIALKQGPQQVIYIDLDEWLANWEFSDDGAFMEAMDSGTLCWELLNSMQPQGRSVAIARHILGYSWHETADSLGISSNAAQKALSSGIRKAFGVCVRELQKMGYHRVAELESHLMKQTTKKSLGRKSKRRHESR